MEIDGILAEIVKDMATYDLRNWRKAGITPDEIRTRLEHPELCSDIFDKAISEDRFPNVSGSRIFGYLWKELQKIPCADKVIEAVMSHRTEELRKWANYMKDDGERHYKGSLEEDIARFLSALDGFRQNPKSTTDLLFAIEHLEGYIHHAKTLEEWRRRTVEALGETFTYAEWFDPLIKKAEGLLSSVNRNALVELDNKIKQERQERYKTTTSPKRQKKPKVTTKPLGEILSNMPASKAQPQTDSLSLVAQLEKETHGRTFDEVRQPDEAEQLLKKYGWTKIFDEKWRKWSLKSNRGFDKLYDHEPTLDDIKEAVLPTPTPPQTPPSVSTPQSSNTKPSNVRTLLEEEASQVHDYFTLNLEDAKIDPTKYEEEFKKALDPQKTWQENLAVMDALIKKIRTQSQPQTPPQPPTPPCLPSVPMLPKPQERLALPEPESPIPEVDCELHVQGGTDPTNTYEQMFFVEIVPKGLKFPEEFFIARGISTTKELERYMKEGLDLYSEEESIGMSGDEEWEKEILAKLPAPFNELGGCVYLKWKCPDDVSFDKAGEILWDFYTHTFTAEELEAKTVGELKIVAAVKGVQRPDRKAELIANILSTSVLKEPEAKTEQKESGDPPQSQPVQEGVPQGFYSNEYLIDINKGFQPACEEGKYPKSMKCWKEDCDKPLEVCGYPFYICDNKHAFNIVTGERWLWKGYDEEYHGLLNVLQGHLEPTYQKLFFPQSRAKTHTEADRGSTRLTSIGDTLYDLLNVQTPDPYHWGKDTHKHHAGLRFAINMMAQAIQKGKAVEFPTDRQHGENETTAPDNIEQWDSWQEQYSHDASEFRKILGDEAILKMLTTIPEEETKRSESKPKQASLFDFSQS